MRIGAPEYRTTDSLTYIQTSVESSQDSRLLWYSVPREYTDFLSDLCDAPLVALLLPAMARGEDMQVSGRVSERLYHNVAGPYQALLQQMIPALHRVNVIAKNLVQSTGRANGVATGFSAGVDSYRVVADHFLTDVPASMRLTHLLFNNVGSHGPVGERLFERRYRHVAGIADRLGLPLIKINSNLDEFYEDRLHFERTHTPRNASVPLTLQQGIGRFLYASAYNYTDIRVGPNTTMAHGDPLSLPLLSTDTLDLASTGSERTRVEKTIQLAEFPITHDTLDVCLKETVQGNCSMCSKCLRTQLTLELAGLLGRYEKSFDLAKYRENRKQYIESLIPKTDPLSLEIVDYMESTGADFPAAALVKAWLRNPKQMLKRKALLICKRRL